MATYKLVEGGVRLDGKSFIPENDKNRHWVAYQVWLFEGNIPIPADPPRVPTPKEKRKVDNEFPDVQQFMEAFMAANPSELNKLKAAWLRIEARNPDV